MFKYKFGRGQAENSNSCWHKRFFRNRQGEDMPDEKGKHKYWRTPLDAETIQVSQGRVTVIAERCKGCEFCVQYCPRGVLHLSKQFNPKGYHYPEVKDESRCVNCRFCEILCPEFAIYSVEVPVAT